MARPYEGLPQWFIDRTKVVGQCWEWTGTKEGNGYGWLRWDRHPAKAHRLAWMLVHGPFPEHGNRHVLHHCDNPPCVRPSHLWIGTHADNMADRHRKGRYKALKGEEHPNAKMTWQEVEQIRAQWINGRSQASLAEEHGISPTMVWYIVRNKGWRVSDAASSR